MLVRGLRRSQVSAHLHVSLPLNQVSLFNSANPWIYELSVLLKQPSALLLLELPLVFNYSG